MKIYISGIAGTGMGPLALMAKSAGMEVFGSDAHEGAIYGELVKAGIEVEIGVQDGEFLKKKIQDGVEWLVYTSALPPDAPELKVAREAGIRISKRDNLTEFLVQLMRLKMVAVAGTHGKTTTTAMIIWACQKLGLPAAYIVGSTLGFAPSGSYKDGDKYFIYEADEYDRNFLKFHPWLAVITSVSYDHPDIYQTPEEYRGAFSQFEAQSENVIKNDSVTPFVGDDVAAGSSMEFSLDESRLDGFNPDEFKLAGEVRRQDAAMAATVVRKILENEGRRVALDSDKKINERRKAVLDSNEMAESQVNDEKIIEKGEIVRILSEFPGVGRRFERLADGIYTDYAHHPEEIKATMDVALDEMELTNKKGVVVVYQPHQNTRQHEVQDLYYDAFVGAEKVWWLPTYLTREDESLPVLKPMDLINNLVNAEIAEPAEMNDELFREILKYRDDNYLVLLMTAGPADEWLRKNIDDRFGLKKLAK